MNAQLESRYQSTFHEALVQMGVSLAISAYQANQVLLVRAGEDTINNHLLPLERPTGLAVEGGKLSIASGPQIIEYRNIQEGLVAGEQHDSFYIPRQSHFTGGVDTHEMSYDSEEHLWFVSTRLSCLCTLSRTYSVEPRWRPPFISAYDMTDRCHLNGLAMKSGTPAFLTALGQSDEPGGWRLNRASGGILMSYPSGEIVTDGLSMPHSPRWHNDRLFVLESGEGTLCEVNPKTGERTVITQLPGFTRGLAFFGRYAFVGLSKVRDTNIFGGLPITQRGQDRQCGVALVDTKTGAVLARLEFIGQIEEVFDIKILPVRAPEIVTLNDELALNSVTLPDSALKDAAPPDAAANSLLAARRHQSRGEVKEALVAYKQAISLRTYTPDEANAFAKALISDDSSEEASEYLESMLKRDNTQVNLWVTLAEAYRNQGNSVAVRKALDTACSLDDKYYLARRLLAELDLAEGYYQSGWQGWYEARQLKRGIGVGSHLPLWEGEATSLQGKKLLVVVPQDDGETLYFARFLTALLPLEVNITVRADTKMCSLLTDHRAVDQVSSLLDPLDESAFDYFIYLTDIPYLLGLNDLDAIATCRMDWLATNKMDIVRQGLGVASFDPRHPSWKWGNRELDVFNDFSSRTVINLQPRAPQQVLTQFAEKGIRNIEIDNPSDYTKLRSTLETLEAVIGPDIPVLRLALVMGIPIGLLSSHQYYWPWYGEHDKSFGQVNIITPDQLSSCSTLQLLFKQ